MANSKTIITYLVDGNPTGIKTVELSNRIGKAIIIPRSKLKESKNRKETNQPAIYFLLGEDENGAKKAYIGEGENLIDRLSSHDSEKEFRDIVIAFISTNNSLTKADVKFLESSAIKKAFDAKRFELLNANSPAINNLPEYQKGTMEEFLENIELLMSAVGYPVLKETSGYKKASDKHIYYLKLQGCDAQGVYSDEGFIILKGSKGREKETESFGGKAKLTRNLLLESGGLITEGENIVFLEDFVCSSPSHASSLLAGRASNGWTEWKDSGGKTLHENERRSLI